MACESEGGKTSPKRRIHERLSFYIEVWSMNIFKSLGDKLKRHSIDLMVEIARRFKKSLNNCDNLV